jgi:hypothetical protein
VPHIILRFDDNGNLKKNRQNRNLNQNFNLLKQNKSWRKQRQKRKFQFEKWYNSVFKR